MSHVMIVCTVSKRLLHDDLNTDKVCDSANPTSVGFMHMYEHCYLVMRDMFYITFHWESKTCMDTIKETRIDQEI